MDFAEIASVTKIHRCHRARLEGCSNWEIPYGVTRGAKNWQNRMCAFLAGTRATDVIEDRRSLGRRGVFCLGPVAPGEE